MSVQTRSTRNLGAADALKRLLADSNPLDPPTVGDEYGNEWTVEHVGEDGKVDLSQEVTLEARWDAAEVASQLIEGWDE